MKGTALVLDAYSSCGDGVSLKDVMYPNPGPNQVCVRACFAPINPADLNMIENKYLVQPELPFVLGNEGVGVVETCGSDVGTVQPGDHVILLYQTQKKWTGTWQSFWLVEEQDVLVIDQSIPLKQAAMLTINPVTALQLLQRFVTLQPGDWVIQNAGNSAMGRWLIYCAKKLQLKIVSLVRRKSLINELIQWGGEIVLLDEEGVHQRIVSEYGRMRLALNAVGGSSALRLAKTLESDAALVTYGAMSKKPVVMSNGLLIYRTLSFYGFNRTKWMEDTERSEVEAAYRQVLSWLNVDAVMIPISRTIPVHKFHSALFASAQPGKCLLQFS